MFKNFHGYNLLEAYHRMHQAQKDHPQRVQKKMLQAIFVTGVTLLLWNLPIDSFGIDGTSFSNVSSPSLPLLH